VQWLSAMHIVKIYRDLDAWQAAMALVEMIYGITRMLPRHELFGLTAQLRRAAVAIPSHIAEGACRRTTAAYVNHVSIALGSHAEIETCFEIAMRLGYVPRDETNKVASSIERTGQLLNGLLRSLETREPRP
jgi:four helix bundle protein